VVGKVTCQVTLLVPTVTHVAKVDNNLQIDTCARHGSLPFFVRLGGLGSFLGALRLLVPCPSLCFSDVYQFKSYHHQGTLKQSKVRRVFKRSVACSVIELFPPASLVSAISAMTSTYILLFVEALFRSRRDTLAPDFNNKA
jgi:hypothetical protein